MLVVADASALLNYLLRASGATGIEAVITDPAADVHVPSFCDVEMASAIRGMLLRGSLGRERGGEVLADYLDLPVTRHGHTSLLRRMIGLRHNMSAYDAAYVALAERLNAPLLTADQRLADAVSAHTDVDLAR